MAEVEDISKYYEAWTRTQLDIWREKIERMRIVRTGALHESFASHIAQSEMSATITMRFAQYGIYQALGTGRGYTPGNLGNLEFWIRITDRPTVLTNHVKSGRPGADTRPPASRARLATGTQRNYICL